MAWVELHWGVPRKLKDELISKLFTIGVVGVQEDYLPGEEPPPRQPWDVGPEPPLSEFILIKAWWESPVASSVQKEMLELVYRYPEVHKPSWFNVSEQDWATDWKKHFQRHQISEKLAIAPPWAAIKGDVIIEPGIAFGTGEHPTTYSCLEALSQWSKPGGKCLDVGCGSGVLSLAAASLGMEAYGIDIEDQAITSAKENAKRNGLNITFNQTNISDIKEQYEVVVANLYAEVLVALSSDIISCSSGKLALAGILVEKEDMVREAFCSLTLFHRKVDGDWVALWYTK
jgi:ribosomal protein L11 methyltransferase